MTLLKLFNEKLKELPAISRKLEETIIMGEWTEKKKNQAITIIDQIKKVGSIESVGYLQPYNYITTVPLKITLSPRECGIDNETFEMENIMKADDYIRELLADINNISEDVNVKFSFAGHDYESKDRKCEFSISWEF